MKHTLPVWIIACLVLSNSVESDAQSLPTIIPPSPEAAILTKYIEHPVSNSTGVPDINIPLYTISTSKLKVPISISYHASGRRVSDVTGSLGIGWALNAGGMIARTIYGVADDGVHNFPNPLKTSYNSSDAGDFSVLAGMRKNSNFPTWYDSEYDLFSYVFPGGNGNFILKNNGTAKTPMPIPFKAIRINPVKETATGVYRFQYIDITDVDGTLYRYGKSLKTSNFNAEFFAGTGSVSGWYLSEIVSTDKTDTVSFSYATVNQPSVSHSVTKTYRDNASLTSPSWAASYYGLWTNNAESVNGSPWDFYQVQRLTEIKFAGGKVKFNLHQSTGLLTNMEIIDNQNVVIKSIDFTRSVLDSPSPLANGVSVQKLDQVSFKDNTNSPVEKYVFDYYVSDLGSWDDRRNKDLWGYYSEGATYFPSIDVTLYPGFGNSPYTGTLSSGSREPSWLSARKGVLHTITYPTGGSTEFIYEGNQYLSSANTVKNGGGLRISQIKTFDNAALTSVKTYKYGINESGYGIIPCEPNLNYLVSAKRLYDFSAWANPGDPNYLNYDNNFRELTASSEFPGDIAYFIQKPIGYPEVTEYEGDNVTYRNGKSVYSYDVKTYTPVSFPAINVSTSPNSGTANLGNFGWHVAEYDLWSGNYIKQKSIYRYDAPSSSYAKVKEEIFTYSLSPIESVRGLHVAEPIKPYADGWHSGTSRGGWMAAQYNLPVYMGLDYYVTTGINSLDNLTTKEYMPGGVITTTKNYAYNANKMPSMELVTDSKGDELKTTYLYPSDFPAQLPYSKMVQRNILSPVIQQSLYKNSTSFIQSTLTNYNYWKNGAWGDTTANLIVPHTVETAVGTGSSEVRIRFHKYGNTGNILSVSKEGGVPVSYLYGYNYQYPVAKIENAGYSAVEAALGGAGAVNAFSATALPSDAAVQSFLSPLRSSLPDALVTTYTYKPLVGITGMTDPRGRTTRYDYDPYQRLRGLKDHGGNILKAYEYHLKP